MDLFDHPQVSLFELACWAYHICLAPRCCLFNLAPNLLLCFLLLCCQSCLSLSTYWSVDINETITHPPAFSKFHSLPFFVKWLHGTATDTTPATSLSLGNFLAEQWAGIMFVFCCSHRRCWFVGNGYYSISTCGSNPRYYVPTITSDWIWKTVACKGKSLICANYWYIITISIFSFVSRKRPNDHW